MQSKSSYLVEITQRLASCQELLPESCSKVHKMCSALRESLDLRIRQGKISDNFGLMAELLHAIEEFEIKQRTDFQRNGNLIERQRHILTSLTSEYKDVMQLICQGNEDLRNWIEWLIISIGIVQKPTVH